MFKNQSGSKRTKTKWGIFFLVTFLALINVVAYFHAYRFSHFSVEGRVKTKSPEKLSLNAKLNALFFGINNPRPVNHRLPSQSFQTIRIHSHKTLECWAITHPENTRGTIVLFHGYGASKSTLLDRSDLFLRMGYNTFLVDFMGSGGSEGNQTTVGYKEAEEVSAVYTYLLQAGIKNVYMFGTSMGAVAIMKALHDHDIRVSGVILECPFGSLYETTCARFRTMNTPSFPMAGLLVFWGGWQNGYWGFDHQPIQYAKKIKCPTLLLYGEKDESVSRSEIDRIYNNLQGMKEFSSYPDTGHENYLLKNKTQWYDDVSKFLALVKPG